MEPYDVLVAFPDGHAIDVFFGSWQPAPASLPVAPAIVPYVTRQLANVHREQAAGAMTRLLGVISEDTSKSKVPEVLADELLAVFGAATPTFTESDVFQAVIARHGPRYRRYFYGQVPLGPRAGSEIHLTAKGFGFGSRNLEDASVRSIGAVVAAGLRKTVPPVLETIRKLEALPDMPDELKRKLREGEHAQMLELLEESQNVASVAIIDAVRALDVQLGNVGVSALQQSEVNGRVLDQISPMIDRQLTLFEEIQKLMSNPAPGKAGSAR
jgi:hypothetical protein